MLDTAPPKIYVSKVPDAETTSIPSDAVELTSGVDGYIVNSSIDGLARPDAEIARSVLAGADASRISGRQIPYRNIVLDVIPMPEINANRERLYNILPYGETLRFYFDKRGKVVFIDGEIEKMDGTFAPGKPFSFGVSIICPFPWFQSVELHTQEILAQRTSAFTARNDGDIPAGFMLKNSNHFNDYSIIGLKVDVGGNAFQANANSENPLENRMRSPIELVTTRGSRKFTAQSDVPAFALIAKDSVWPQLPAGNNDVTVTTSFTWEISEEDFDKPFFHFRWRDTYSGV